MKVLILENDPHAVELLRLRLACWGGTVIAAYTPEEAVALAERERPDMVLAELTLSTSPLHGLALIRRLRASRAIADIPLIVHSIYAHHASDLPELAGHVDGILPKPFRLPQLEQLIRRHRHHATECLAG